MKKIAILALLFTFITSGCSFAFGTENHDFAIDLSVDLPRK